MCHGRLLSLCRQLVLRITRRRSPQLAQISSGTAVQIALFQAGLDRHEIPPPIGEESRDDGFKIWIDMIR